MFTFRDVLETTAYACVSAAVFMGCLQAGNAIESYSSTHGSVVSGTPVVSSDYLGVSGNFNPDAVGERGRVTDLTGCDWDTQVSAYYELGPCADHETRISSTPRVYPFPQK